MLVRVSVGVHVGDGRVGVNGVELPVGVLVRLAVAEPPMGVVAVGVIVGVAIVGVPVVGVVVVGTAVAVIGTDNTSNTNTITKDKIGIRMLILHSSSDPCLLKTWFPYPVSAD